MHVYNLEMDRTVRLITFFVTATCMFVSVLLFIVTQIFVALTVSVFIFSIYLLCFLLAPRKVIVREKEILIDRPLKKMSIPLTDIKRVFISEFKGIRIFGVGGLFGFFGIFRIKNIGNVRVYSRSLKKLVILETSGKKIGLGISESEIDEFLKDVKKV